MDNAKISGSYYARRQENNVHKAVECLDKFTKAFCIDVSVKDDLAFRCKECPFEMQDGRCLVKVFKSTFDPGYKGFGSMSNL
jgi:hypothetical protein